MFAEAALDAWTTVSGIEFEQTLISIVLWS